MSARGLDDRAASGAASGVDFEGPSGVYGESAARLADLVRRTERRLLALDAQDAACGAATVALALFAACALAAKVAGPRGSTGWVAASAGLVGLALFAIGLARRRPQTDRAAGRIDAAYDLDDRVRSALAGLGVGGRPGLSSGTDALAAPGPLFAVLIADAADAARGVDPRRAVAYERPRRLGALLAAAIAAVAVAAFPSRALGEAPPDAAEVGNVRAAGEELAVRSLAVAAKEDPRRSDTLRAVARDQADLGAELRRDPPPAREALEKLSRLEERIDSVERYLGDRNREALDRARRALGLSLAAAGAVDGAQADATGRNGDARAGSGASDANPGDAKSDPASRALSDAARAAAGAARDGKLGDAERREIQEAASKLAKELENVAGAEELRDAAAAAADGDATAEELEKLAEALRDAEGKAADEDAAAQLRAANRAAKQRVAGLARGAAIEGEPGGFAGHGSTNDRDGQPYSPEDLGSTMNSSDARPDASGAYEAKYGDTLEGRAGYTSKAKGQLQGGGKGTSLYVQSAPGSAPASAPYQSVFPQYRRSAERSIERSDVPPDMRGVVRGYFDSINPR